MEVRNGNFNVRMPIDQVGLNGKICNTLNAIIPLNERPGQSKRRGRRVEGPDHHEYEGIGIGLALWKKIVEEHNGYISARSAVGQGSTFIISLPSALNKG